jgi:bifunctional non-homologous end joining protein LigD
MIPTYANTPPKGDAWLHEPKWDGYRFQIVKNGDKIRLYSKSGADWTDRLPAMVEAFAELQTRAAILDGELCICDDCAFRLSRPVALVEVGHPI